MKIARKSRVTYVDHMGDDLATVNAARVSFAKEATHLRKSDAHLIDYLATGMREREREQLVQDLIDCNNEITAKRLVRMLRHQPIHFAPFTHCVVKFRIAAPIFVARQLWKSHIGLANQDEALGWSEVSRRYVDDEPEFYLPEGGFFRRAEDIKQGASSELLPWSEHAAHAAFWVADKAYRFLLWRGAAPEDARMILPSALMTEWIWTGSLMSFARICHLRLDGHAQSHTRDVAEDISREISGLFPESWRALMS